MWTTVRLQLPQFINSKDGDYYDEKNQALYCNNGNGFIYLNIQRALFGGAQHFVKICKSHALGHFGNIVFIEKIKNGR